MEFVVIWVVFGLAAAVVATSKGRPAQQWFVIGILFGLIALLVAIGLPPTAAAEAQRADDLDAARMGSGRVPCPYCAEPIKAEAIVCRYCGREVTPRAEEASDDPPVAEPVAAGEAHSTARGRRSPIDMVVIGVLLAGAAVMALAATGRGPFSKGEPQDVYSASTRTLFLDTCSEAGGSEIWCTCVLEDAEGQVTEDVFLAEMVSGSGERYEEIGLQCAVRLAEEAPAGPSLVVEDFPSTRLGSSFEMEDLVGEFLALMTPVIRDHIIYTAATDPNELMGKESGYIGKATFTDRRLDLRSPDFDVELGGSIELFRTHQEARDRAAHIARIAPVAGVDESHYIAGPILLRLSALLTDEQAREYWVSFLSLHAEG